MRWHRTRDCLRVGMVIAGLAFLAPRPGLADLVGKMTAKRIFPQATLLQDGTVLVAGGWGGSSGLATAERFDPQTGQFTAVAPMATRRDDSLRATRLADGKVLITSGTASKRAELFDPATNTFLPAGNM